MNTEPLKAKIRSIDVLIDYKFEEQIGVYGEAFWNGITTGDYESDTFDFIELRAKAGSKVFIDVGSATGCMVFYAAAMGMKVIGTEPQNLIFEALRRNLDLNPKFSDKVTILHSLVANNSQEELNQSKFFTPGANGPLQKAIDATNVSLKTLLSGLSIEDKVSVKVDIEGAEYPLLSDIETLKELKEKRVTMYLSFHPGFNRYLGASPSFVKLNTWRIFTLIETFKFVRIVQRFAKISLLNSNHKLSLLKVLKKLAQDQKDYVLSF